MKTPVDERLRIEASTFRLRHACEDCAHFETASERCAEGYPNEAHRALRLATEPFIEFCKSYELA